MEYPSTTDHPFQRAAATTARAHAAGRGWLPPLAWDNIDTDPDTGPPQTPLVPEEDLDHIAIERAIAGDNIRLTDLTAAEQQAVIGHLTQHGRSVQEIATQLHTTKRTVSRRRAVARRRRT